MLKKLFFLLQRNKAYDHVANLLKKPDSAKSIWRDIGSDPSQLLAEIRTSLNHLPELALFFEVFLSAAALLTPDNSADIVSRLSFLGVDINVMFSGLFPQDTSESLNSFSFSTVPVIMTIPQKKAEIVYFIIGSGDVSVLTPFPKWVERVMDKSAMAAVNNACLAVDKLCVFTPGSGKGKFCFPLVLPLNNGPVITGASLGLPLAVGLIALIRNQKISDFFVATGRVAKDGLVQSVSLNGKISCADEHNFTAFVYPNSVSPQLHKNGISLFPVCSLAEAVSVADLWDLENNSQIHTFMGMITGDVNCFISNIDHIDAVFINYGIKNKLFSKYKASILSDKKTLEIFSRQFYNALKSSERTIDDKYIIGSLITLDDMPQISKKSAKAAFLIASVMTQKFNHRGETNEAEKWRRQGEINADEALKRGEFEPYCDFFNYISIIDHNKFKFNPAVPDNINNVLEYINKSYNFDGVNKTAGKFYGTLSQLYGFCGPAYFDEFMKFHNISLKCFGKEFMPDECEGEWRRQYNYLAYAAMDKKNYIMAEKAIKEYIGLATDENLMDSLGSDIPYYEFESVSTKDYLQACLCRFIAETKNIKLAKTYMNRSALKLFEKNRREHPYQLWFFNLGRIAIILGEMKKAKECFKKSLDICMSEGRGETIIIMALLPLSYLYHFGWWDDEFVAMFKTIKDVAISVNKKYFSEFLVNNMEEILCMIYNKPEKFFPFTYR